MAFATLAASSVLATPSYATDRHSLSCSSSPFLESSTLRFVPLKCRAPRAAISSPKCGLVSEEEVPSKSTVRRNVLAGLVATGAALAVFTNVSLASAGSAQDAANVAQNAGSGAVSDLQAGFKSIFGQGQDKKAEIEKSAKDVVSQTQSGGGGLVQSAKDAVGQTQSGGGGLLDSLQGRVQGLKEGVEEKDADAKNALQQAESTAKDIVQ